MCQHLKIKRLHIKKKKKRSRFLPESAQFPLRSSYRASGRVELRKPGFCVLYPPRRRCVQGLERVLEGCRVWGTGSSHGRVSRVWGPLGFVLHPALQSTHFSGYPLTQPPVTPWSSERGSVSRVEMRALWEFGGRRTGRRGCLEWP